MTKPCGLAWLPLALATLGAFVLGGCWAALILRLWERRQTEQGTE